MRECRAPRKLLLRIQCLQEENFQPPASAVLYFRAFLKMQEMRIKDFHIILQGFGVYMFKQEGRI